MSAELAIKEKLRAGPIPIREVFGLKEFERDEIGRALGRLRKSGVISVAQGKAMLE